MYASLVVRLAFVIRSSTPERLSPLIRSEVAEVDPQLALFDLANLQSLVDRSMARSRFDSFLMGAFAAVAVTLAIVGIYGLTSYLAAGRGHEIGVRMALGASRRNVLSLILRQSALTALSGSAVGAVAALGSARLLGSLLFQVSVTDPVPFLAAGLTLNLAALAAAFLPAHRASRTDPQQVLRGVQ